MTSGKSKHQIENYSTKIEKKIKSNDPKDESPRAKFLVRE